MSAIPLTRCAVSTAKARAIRSAVRAVDAAPGGRKATAADVDALYRLLADPAISDPIYSLPKPITRASVADFVAAHEAEQARGDGLLLLARDDAPAAAAYHDIQFWPQWAACELGGAVRADLQGKGGGGAGAAAAFEWLFEEIGVDLICETAALDNIRTARLLERLGFACKGEVISTRPDGRTRPSRAWELTRTDWRARQRSTID